MAKPREAVGCSITHCTVFDGGCDNNSRGVMRPALAVVLLLLGACSQRHARVSAPGNLAAPTLVAPRDQAVLTNHPRTVRLEWSRVPRAAGYGIEIDCYGCCAPGQWCSDVPGKSYLVPNLTAITYTLTFWGDQRGRWRVWTVDARSKPGPKSAWSGFEFQAARQTNSSDPKKPSPFGTR